MSNQKRDNLTTKRNNVVDVLVVGAGFSGLYAAQLLQQAKLSVAVLEARDRVGGRVLSQHLADGTTIDLGAQWISPYQRRISALVQKYNLNTIMTHTKGDSIIKVGEHLQRISGEMPQVSWISKLDIWQIGWRLDRIAKTLSVTEPWRHPKAKQLDSISFNDWLAKNVLSQEARQYWHYITESGLCTSCDRFSPLEVLQQIASIGGLKQLETADYEFLEKGTQTIAQKMADELGNCVHLLAPVRSLKYDGQLVRAITDREEFYGKRIILALPPQLMETISFDNEFADQLDRRPKKLLLGQIIKNIIVYKRAWWRDLGLSGTADTPGEPIDFLVDSSNKAGEPGILVAFASGSSAASLSQIDSETRQTIIMTYIQKILGKAPASPQYFVSMDWISEPWSCGGYASRRAIGEWINWQDTLTTSRAPLHFAGTETATEWRSYIEGALQSAERASKEVINALNR